MPLKLLKHIKWAYLFVRARSRTAKKEYAAALSDLQMIYGELGVQPPSSRATIATNALFSLLALRLASYELSLEAVYCVSVQLSSGVDRYTPAERNHIARYCRQVAERAAYLGSLPLQDDLCTPEPYAAGRVSQSVYLDFPLAANRP